MTIEVNDNGKVRSYTLKEPHEWTISDYRKLKAAPVADLKEDRERLIEMVKASTGIPKAHLRRIPIATFNDLMSVMADVVEHIGQGLKDAEQDPAETFKFEGKTYAVPQDLESGSTYGQWEDFNNVLLPQAGEDEASVWKATCAAFCLPEGDEYTTGGVLGRMKDFERLPITTAMAVSAFFFASSSEYNRAISRFTSSFLNSLLPKNEPEHKPSGTATERTLASTELHN